MYPGLYDGIDPHIRGLRSRLKYEFHVAPGADYRRIAARYEGITGLSIREDGSLAVDLGGKLGVIRDDAPYVYQEIDGRKVELGGRFVIRDDRTYSFEVAGDVRPGHPLVIDPNLVWSSYLGGTNNDYATDAAADTAGNVYVVGWTDSPGWTSGGFDTTLNGEEDALVLKITDGAGTATGTRIPVYRFWSSATSRHFYTTNESEKQGLIDNFSHVWVYEGIAYYALPDGNEPGSLPVYRFWSQSSNAHFYTISEAEKDTLIRDYEYVWTFEGPVFYAYPEGAQPAGTAAVYRFWSPATGFHFYTISETEKDMLTRDYPAVWTFEGIAWYAYPP